MLRRGLLLSIPAAAHAVTPLSRLRVGIGIASVSSAFWATRGPDGIPRGVTVDLATAAARAWGAQLELGLYDSSTEVVAAVAAGAMSLGFVPIDAERARQVGVGPNYYLSVSTLLVPASSALLSLAQADQPGVTIAGVRGTTTLRAAEAAMPRARIMPLATVAQAVAALQQGQAQAVALGLESLRTLVPQLPGSRILDGHFHALGTAIIVPPGQPGWLQAATLWMEQAKADGSVRAALDAHGIDGPVAPAGSRLEAPGASPTGAPG